MRAPENDSVSVRIMDAALAEYLAHGLRRTSVDDVARAAGLGRATVYRRFATRDELVHAVLAREARRFFAEIAAATQDLSVLSERLIEGFVVGLRIARRQPLLNQLIKTEPDSALPLLTVRGGPLLVVLREFLVRQLVACADGLPPGVCPQEEAEILVRLVMSLVLTPQTCLPLDDEVRVREFARRCLAPLLTPSPA